MEKRLSWPQLCPTSADMLDFCEEGFCHCDWTVIDCISSNHPVPKQDGDNQPITSQTGNSIKSENMHLYLSKMRWSHWMFTVIFILYLILILLSYSIHLSFMFPSVSPFVTDIPDNDTYTSDVLNGTGEAVETHISSLFYPLFI